MQLVYLWRLLAGEPQDIVYNDYMVQSLPDTVNTYDISFDDALGERYLAYA